jgi:hypothetical protein
MVTQLPCVHAFDRKQMTILVTTAFRIGVTALSSVSVCINAWFVSDVTPVLSLERECYIRSLV